MTSDMAGPHAAAALYLSQSIWTRALLQSIMTAARESVTLPPCGGSSSASLADRVLSRRKMPVAGSANCDDRTTFFAMNVSNSHSASNMSGLFVSMCIHPPHRHLLPALCACAHSRQPRSHDCRSEMNFAGSGTRRAGITGSGGLPSVACSEQRRYGKYCEMSSKKEVESCTNDDIFLRVTSSSVITANMHEPKEDKLKMTNIIIVTSLNTTATAMWRHPCGGTHVVPTYVVEY